MVQCGTTLAAKNGTAHAGGGGGEGGRPLAPFVAPPLARAAGFCFAVLHPGGEAAAGEGAVTLLHPKMWVVLCTKLHFTDRL